MPDTPPPNGERRVSDYRLTVLEQSVADLRKQLDDGIRAVRADIGQLTYVRQDVYELEKLALAKEVSDTENRLNVKLAEIADDASGAKALSMWSLGLIVSAVIVAIIALGVRVAFG